MAGPRSERSGATIAQAEGCDHSFICAAPANPLIFCYHFLSSWRRPGPTFQRTQTRTSGSRPSPGRQRWVSGVGVMRVPTMLGGLIAVVAMALVGAAPARAAGLPVTHPVVARLVSETVAVAPGMTLWLD